MSFQDLQLIAPLQQALEAEGYTTPTPIQSKAIPVILQGRDMFGCAQTGTGKTAAFALPILQLIEKEPAGERGKRTLKVLILTPTRELAIQIGESFDAYGRFMRLTNTVIFGGVKQKSQTDALERGVDVLIATPGRMLDLMSQGFISLKNLKIFVLDEADRMLDMGFIHDIRKVVAKLPAQRQSLFFSATMPSEIMTLANTILTNPVSVEVTPVSSTAENVKQCIYFVHTRNKNGLLAHLLETQLKEAVLVFTRTKHGADKVVKHLAKVGITAEAIHGNKSQNARQRALSNFKSGETRVLIASDIAARGIDIDSLSYVVNYDLPNISETYVHRIGRTGRAGAKGSAISFCASDERPYLKDIEKLIGQKVPVIEVHPFQKAPEDEEEVLPEERGSFRRPAPGGGASRGGQSGQNRYGTSRPSGDARTGSGGANAKTPPTRSGAPVKKQDSGRPSYGSSGPKKGPSSGGGRSGGGKRW